MKRFVFATTLTGILLSPLGASAFCRTTVCDPRFTCAEKPDLCCVQDVNGCDTNTRPISWPTSCVSFNVHEDGSSKLDISANELSDILNESFDQWLSPECDGGGVSLAVDYRGKAQCGTPEYNQGENDSNANVWMFRDSGTNTGMSEEFGLDDAALAVTTVMFNERTAEIYDVDVELLSSSAQFTTTDNEADVIVDLASVVTHEAGHFLGLDHSLFPGATMKRGYFPGCPSESLTPQGDCLEPRTLSQDDKDGICAAYPEGRSFPGGKTCEPRGEYSPECHESGCGCSTVGRDRPIQAPLWLFGALGLFSVLRRRTNT